MEAKQINPKNDTRIDTGSDTRQAAAELVARMSIEEQALLLSGDGWWRTQGIARLGLPSIWVADEGGQWREAIPYIGFPGGKTKTIAVDVSDALGFSKDVQA